MSEDDDQPKTTLDLSKQMLKKVPKHDNAQNIRTLILNDNDLQKIDNIDSYFHIEKLSICRNQLLRMYGVCRLHSLTELNLSFNGILTIEGLKELTNLQILNLEGNNIKTIEHLNTNIKLESLNLSENTIGSISDISFLKSLKKLYLHSNRLTHLRLCDKYLPISLEVLTLSKNSITDLNEVCTLANLSNLHSISVNDNPCVQMNRLESFDHRPFVLNWCLNLKTIDSFVVDPIESLKAEWLFSQGRGRQFRVGEQEALAKYLNSVCPMIGKALEDDNERKLRLILSKAQHHQRQLQEEISDNLNISTGNSPLSNRKKSNSRIQSPRFSRLSGRQGSPDSMSNSYHGNVSSSNDHPNNILQMTTSLIENIKNDSLMIQSFDGNNCNKMLKTSQDPTPRAVTPNQYGNEQTSISAGGPLTAASKMVPVPETLMSPDCCPSIVSQKISNLSAAGLQNSKIVKNKDNRSRSPKVIRSPYLKKNEKSPLLSPRKTMITTVQNSPHNVKASENIIKSRNLNANNEVVTPPLVNNSLAGRSRSLSSDDDSDHINIDKLKTIRNKAAQRSQQQKENFDLSSVKINKEAETSAIVIQKLWRGYKARKATKTLAEKVLKKRTLEYIEKLSKDMETTKAQLENEKKIQQLQMQAINALWKKVATLQNESANSTSNKVLENSTDQESTYNSNSAVTDLTKTCSLLTNQVQQLQCSMHDILNCMSLFCKLPQDNLKKLLSSEDEQKLTIETQTEIIAVHTPQIENQQNFPYKIRPSSLPLDQSTTSSAIQNLLIEEKDYKSLENEKSDIDNKSLDKSESEKFEKEQEQCITEKFNA